MTARGPWTPAMDTMMVKLWNAGKPVADIATALTEAGHATPTRGTILGRLHRLRAGGRLVLKRPAPKRDLSKAMTHRRERFDDRGSPKKPTFMDMPVLPGDAENPGHETTTGCQWPLRDVQEGRRKITLHCGKTRIDRSWCEAHRARVFRAQPTGETE